MDEMKAMKEKMEDYLTTALNCTIAPCLKISYFGLKMLKKVTFSYMDLIADTILLSNVMVVVTLSVKNFSLFTSQVALLLLCSIVVPLLVSAITVALKRPFVILNQHQWKQFTTNKSKKPLWIARSIILFLFPIIRAIILVSNETAKEELASLKSKTKKKIDEVENSVLEESELTTN